MKKLFSLIITLVLVLSTFAFTATSVAAEENLKFKSAYNFDFLEEGFQLGGVDDEGNDGETKYVVADKVGLYFDLPVVTERAYSGKAMAFKSVDGGSGVYAPITINLKQNTPKVTDFSGAKEFMFYIDITGWGEARGVRPVITENGCDATGELVNESTTWMPDGTKGSFIEDGKGGWIVPKQVDGTIELPQDYKGFVKVPVENFIKPEWCLTDSNKKFDCKEIVQIAIELGCYDRNDGKSIIIDEIGFTGDFADGTTLPLLQGQQKVEPSSEAQSSSDSSNSSTSVSKEESSKPANAGMGDMTTIIIIVVTAVVVIAAVVVIIMMMKKKPTTEPAAKDKEENNKK